ncbi:efflux RND transporter permease subunit [Paenibacillus mucilaginosus]|uniref:Putative efflux system n=1 Tax=Paenibacillus mucilaginosus (strain KNP414) TaxID=1036673 RepID=F8FMF5_PAEMK|nr:efflux RND transporter permease subunit [Paenibacillus mucilaginosus]AEI40038.1 putative efflux system [Paenibacillus mucilaginosus KNP414]MCG7215648.1 efflux RND transporter permease subunit [Paenibacillus mucilaginosus]WDM29282.1 efflux RND transporter permease subunit [Paenibacillus mucilaginosus]
MNSLTRFSMKNVAALIIIIAMLFGGGMYAAFKLKIENFPDISFPYVMVTTTYQAAPEDVMEEITKPIEDKVGNMEDLNNMTSTSNDSMSSVILEFKQGVDVDKKKQDVESLMQELNLPSSAGNPKVSTFGFSSQPAYYMAIYAKDGMSQTELDRIYEDQIEPAFEGIAGVDHIDSVGTRETKMDIELDADALSAYGLTPSGVTDAIRSALNNGPIGTVELSGNEKMARITADVTSVYALQELEITTENGAPLLLGQIAKVQAVMESEFVARLDGHPALGIQLYKTSSANAVDFSADVESYIEQWKTTMPGVEFKLIYDSADEVEKSIHGLVKEGIIGAVLAAVMILLFLRNLRMTLIVLVSIPLSILVTLLLMMQLDITLNTMTLGGIFIAVGRVVDDSIVVIENIYTELQKAQERGESVILKATSQVAMAITSSTIATCGVFAPIGLVSGIVGEIFRPFAITLVVALMTSLIVAVTVIPMLAKILVLRDSKLGAGHGHDEAPKGRIMNAYERMLHWSLNNRIKTLLASLLLLVVSIAAIVPNLAVSFVPSGTTARTMYYQLKLPYDTSMNAMDAKAKELEVMMQEAKDSQGGPLFTYVESLVGYGGDDEQVPYKAEIYVEVSQNADPDQVKNEYKELILNELPAGSEVEPRTLGGEGGISTTDFSYSLKGDDQDQLEQALDIIRGKLETYPELSEIEDSISDSKTQVEITVDQRKARAYGLSAAAVRESASAWIAEQELGDIKLDNITYTTTISLAGDDKNSLEKLGIMPLKSSSGTTVYLNEIAKIREVEAPMSIQREAQEQLVSVTAKINSTDKSGVAARISSELNQLELPDGVSREVKGVSEDINESFSQLFMAMGVAVFMVYLIMVLAFGNASAPFAILFSLPLAAIGGLIGLFISGESLNVTSLIGFMMLIGIVVTNAIVLVDRAQQMRAEGYTVRHALLDAGMVRLRPIIMTAGATIVALLPLALGFSDSGGMISKGLAVVVIGGLTTSTLLTLFVVPIVYELIESMKARLARRFSRNKGAGPDITQTSAGM